jgi:AraC-like DNA-binding protein
MRSGIKTWMIQPRGPHVGLIQGDRYPEYMDVAHTTPRAGPVVVWANWYRFRAGEHIVHPIVESVSYVWGVQGSGVISSGGERFTLTSNSILRLPWGHDVEYQPDSHSPFRVGTIHLVPWHDAAVPVFPGVGFEEVGPMPDAASRNGTDRDERAVMLSSRSTSGRSVIALASYCVERFLAGRTNEDALRSLGALIVEESAGWNTGEPVATGFPAVLELMTDHILANIDRHLSVAEIAHAGQCSATTAERMFARYTGLSVLSWSRRRRMEEAALLLRTSGLRVNEVARRVGYADPLYFSRVFSAVHSVAPSRYAQGQLRP